MFDFYLEINKIIRKPSKSNFFFLSIFRCFYYIFLI